MITLTEDAQKELLQYFEDKEMQPIRLHLADGGCSGPRLSLALDAPRDGDLTFKEGELTFLILEDLFRKTGNITIDMSEYGLMIKSENSLGGGGGCGGCGGGCGCN